MAPELVVNDAEGRPFSVRYHVLPALLLNEVQKQHTQLSGQTAEIAALKEQLAELSQLVNRIALLD